MARTISLVTSGSTYCMLLSEQWLWPSTSHLTTSSMPPSPSPRASYKSPILVDSVSESCYKSLLVSISTTTALKTFSSLLPKWPSLCSLPHSHQDHWSEKDVIMALTTSKTHCGFCTVKSPNSLAWLSAPLAIRFHPALSDPIHRSPPPHADCTVLLSLH